MSRRSNVGPKTRGVDVRTALWLLGGLMAAGLIVLAVLWLRAGDTDGPVKITPHPRSAQAVLAYAGHFPARSGTPLRNPRGIDGDNARIYVADADSGNVAVFGKTGERLGTIRLSGVGQARPYPIDVAALASDRLVVVDGNSGAVSLLTVDDELSVISTAAVGDGVRFRHATAVAASGGHIFVAYSSPSNVVEYDGEGVQVGRVRLPRRPKVRFAGDLAVLGDRLIVTDAAGARVVEMSRRSGKVVGAFDVRAGLPRGCDLDAATGYTFFAEVLEGTITVVDTARRVVFTWPAGRSEADVVDRPEHLWFDERTGRLYFTDSGSGRVTVLNVAVAASGQP